MKLSKYKNTPRFMCDDCIKSFTNDKDVFDILEERLGMGCF